MLTDPSIEKLKAKSASPYDLAVLVSKRARELTDGAQPMVDDTDAANVVSLACREVAADKIVAVEGDVSDQVIIPITREEKIRRIEEERTRQRLLEEERLVRDGGILYQIIRTRFSQNMTLSDAELYAGSFENIRNEMLCAEWLELLLHRFEKEEKGLLAAERQEKARLSVCKSVLDGLREMKGKLT